jgi:hypothetical protein
MKGSMLRAAACMLPMLAVLAAFRAFAAEPPVPMPPAAALMALAFPGWREHAGHLQTVTLPQLPGGARGAHAGWLEGANLVLAEAGPLLRFDQAHLTLVAGLVPAGADGKPAAAQLTPMALAAYRFERREGSWRLAGGHDIFAFRGFSGSARLRAVALSGRHQAVALEYGSCFEGYCGSWLALYEADKDAVRHQPAVELALSGRNVDAATDCVRRLQPLVKVPAPPGGRDRPARDDGATAAPHDCYAITSSWELGTAGDLLIRYQGAISRADGHAPVAIDQRQVLRYGNGRYRAVSGFDPVPAI